MVDLQMTLAGESVRLLPERALFHPAADTLYIADLHLGKHAVFRAQGVPLPGGSGGDLARLAGVVARTGARRLVTLGDLLHGRASLDTDTRTAFAAWRTAHSTLDLLLIRGNHDLRAGDPPSEWGITCADAPYPAPPFVLLHDPNEAVANSLPEHTDLYALSGHLHPAALLQGRGRQQIKLPAFWQTARAMVLPAFSDFTAGLSLTVPRRDPTERLYGVTAGEVFPL